MIQALIFDCFDVMYLAGPQRLERNEELLEYVAGLKARYKIALLSNGSSRRMEELFPTAERDKWFDAVLTSDALGLAKPDPGIYQYACDVLGVLPAEAVMIDDLEMNCLGAQRAGLGYVQYQNMAQLKHELEQLL
jgi:putative hydrolase of the HAD superfamily